MRRPVQRKYATNVAHRSAASREAIRLTRDVLRYISGHRRKKGERKKEKGIKCKHFRLRLGANHEKTS